MKNIDIEQKILEERKAIEELEEKRNELRDKIAKMIMDSDVTMQIAIVEAQIQERGK